MNLRKIFLVILISIASLQICFGQNIPEYVEGENNWVQQYGVYQVPFITLRYDRYSKEDTVKFREKLDLMKDAKFSDEWDGIYYVGSEETVNHSELRINSNIGFVGFNVYTCLPELLRINYGKIVNTADFIQLVPEFTENSPRKSEPAKYVKVKWGDKYLLVEESSLSAFAEKAVGIYVEPDEDSSESRFKWTNFWVKGDLNSENHHQVENEYTGLPQFPESYKKIQRSPIEAKIISVGKRAIEKDIEIGGWVHSDETAVYRVTIGAGLNKGVKKGMIFYSAELNEMISIIQVNPNNAVGLMSRDIDENKNDHCLDNDANKIPCPKISSSLKVKTQMGKFGFW